MIFKLILKYDDSDYCCPFCGCESIHCESNGNWGYVCKDCGQEFETPDA